MDDLIRPPVVEYRGQHWMLVQPGPDPYVLGKGNWRYWSIEMDDPEPFLFQDVRSAQHAVDLVQQARVADYMGFNVAPRRSCGCPSSSGFGWGFAAGVMLG